MKSQRVLHRPVLNNVEILSEILHLHCRDTIYANEWKIKCYELFKKT